MTASDIVTGEAVALELPIASLARRFLGGLIDGVLEVIVLVGLVFAVMSVADHLDEALGRAALVGITAIAYFILPMSVEILTGGRSLGKLACGTRVVRVDHGPVTPRQSLVRALIGIAEIWLTLAVPAGCAVFVTARRQRLGDLAAGTLVVRERLPIVTPPPVHELPYLAPWIRTADVGDIQPGVAIAMRQFLARRDTLSPIARDQLGRSLAAEALQRVSPQPPVAAPPEDIIATVLAERGRRDFERWTTVSRRWNRIQDATARRAMYL